MSEIEIVSKREQQKAKRRLYRLTRIGIKRNLGLYQAFDVAIRQETRSNRHMRDTIMANHGLLFSEFGRRIAANNLAYLPM